MQIGGDVELFTVFKNNHIRVIKRSKILCNASGNMHGFICPRFLREIAILKQLSNPPKHLRSHPGRNHVIKLYDVHIDSHNGNEYICIELEYADGTLHDLIVTNAACININIKHNDIKDEQGEIDNICGMKDKILTDIAKGLQYIHELGINHNDINLRNIVYFTKNYELTKFALIDFGNSFYNNKPPYALELSTIYTMPVEMVNAYKITQNIDKCMNSIAMHDKNCKEKTLYNNFKFIKNALKKIKKYVVHKKSDIWSFGSLAYFLHTYEFYASGGNIDQQKEMIELQYKNNINNNNNNNHANQVNEVMININMMLTLDHNKRPILYYSHLNHIDNGYNNNNHISLECKSIDHHANTNTNINKLYIITMTCIIDNMSIINNKYHLINLLDTKIKIKIINHCHNIEITIIKKIIIDIENMLKFQMEEKINDGIKIEPIKDENLFINIIPFVRLLIVWLVSHMYINNLWSNNEIINYIHKTNITANKNHQYINELVKKISIMILKLTSWNLEKYNPIFNQR